MLFYFEEYEKYVEITGYRNISFQQAEHFLKEKRQQTQQAVWVQFFNANLIATQQHLYFAVLNALQAFKNKTNISKSLAMETMLYASAQRQIQRAILRLGIKQDCVDMAVVIIGEKPKEIDSVLKEISAHVGTEPDETVLELSEDKQKSIQEAFGIGAEELRAVQKGGDLQGALVDLVVEQVALLSTQL